MWVVRNLNQFNVTITSLKHQCGCASTHTMHTTIFLSRFVLVIVQHFEIFVAFVSNIIFAAFFEERAEVSLFHRIIWFRGTIIIIHHQLSPFSGRMDRTRHHVVIIQHQALNTNSVHETDAEVPRPQVHETDNVEDNVVHDSLFTSLSGDLDGKDVANTYQKMEFLGQDIIDQLMNEEITPTQLKDQLQTALGCQMMSTQFKMKLGTIWKVQSWLNNYFISDDTKRPVDANIQRDYISKVSNKILSTTKFGDKTAVIRGRVASAVQANVFEDCRYNNNAHAVMSEVLDYLEKYGFIGMYDEIVTQENNESSSEVQPLEQNNINETSQLVVTEDDDEDAKQSEQSKDMEDAQKKPKKPKKPRGGNKRGLGKFVCVAKPSEIEKKKK
eukprot:589939_1